jgi:hypothetical protein
MPLTTFLELDHLFSLFNVIRARRYLFQADINDVTVLQLKGGLFGHSESFALTSFKYIMMVGKDSTL